MNSSHPQDTSNNSSTRKVFDIVLRLIALAFLLYWSFNILAPFVQILIWSVIFAVSLYPVFLKLSKRMGGSKAWAATLISLLLLVVIIAPTVWLMSSTADDIISFRDKVSVDGFAISPPPESVKNIPLVGRKIDQLWTDASQNLSGFAHENNDRLKSILLGIIGLISSVAKGILLLSGAIIVGGVLMCYGQQTGVYVKKFFIRLAGKNGESMASVAEVTIRNVTRGILGVAAIQSLLAGIGMVVFGVPLAGLWTMLWLILAIVQIPALPVAVGVIVWAWSNDLSTGMAILLTIWMLVAGLIDNVLKPIMLGKGAPVPMLVVFLGAIGGFIFSGFTGLFTGAIVLSLAYKLFIEWLNETAVVE
ncbi:MAG: AI-2E family transporter [Chitinophagales bacterium]